MAPKRKKNIEKINFSDLNLETTEADVRYNDDELIIVDNIRDIPDPKACKLSFNVVLFCVQGKFQLNIMGRQLTLNAGQVFFAHSHVTVEDIMVSPNIQCAALCISDRVLSSILQAQLGIWTSSLYRRHYYITETSACLTEVLKATELVFNREDSLFKQEILISILRAAFLSVCEELMTLSSGISKDAKVETTRSSQLFRQFVNNLQCKQIKKRHVAEYAGELFITPKYLNAICQKESGKSPLEWITEYVVQDITYYLRNTELTSTQIADELGFSNPSFFGKFVKTYLGCTPNEYRKKAAMGEKS